MLATPVAMARCFAAQCFPLLPAASSCIWAAFSCVSNDLAPGSLAPLLLPRLPVASYGFLLLPVVSRYFLFLPAVCGLYYWILLA